MPKTITVPLDAPVTIDGKEYKDFTLREPLVRDSIEAAEATKSDAAREAYLIGIISGVGAGVISQLTVRQYAKLIESFALFFYAEGQRAGTAPISHENIALH